MKTSNRMSEPLIFERSQTGKTGVRLPDPGVPEQAPEELIPAAWLRSDIEGFPQVSEVEVSRHFTRLSTLNFSVDRGLYPLGSCTMKYNPKINEELSGLPGFKNLHPHLPEECIQGALELMYRLEEAFIAITGLPAFTLQPAAGAHGELAGVMMIRRRHELSGNPRKHILIPDSAHGTNPASAAFAGYEVIEIPSNDQGTINLDVLEQTVNEDTAALMVTIPNTLGIFEKDICRVSEILHTKGAFLYCDGANFNAFAGMARPGDMGVDVLHLNLHKTFSTPHGGGGPGAGPVGVSRALVSTLPAPRVIKGDRGFELNSAYPESIGRIRSFYSNFAILIRAYAYLLMLGGNGLRSMSIRAVLNANYLRAKLKEFFHLKYDSPTLHEVVFDDRFQEDMGIKNIDIAKRLLDYGFHPPTMSFPLIVHGALMIEPTETEDKRELDAFIQAMKEISEECRTDPEWIKQAPHTTPVRRLDEVTAARNPVIRWTPHQDQ